VSVPAKRPPLTTGDPAPVFAARGPRDPHYFFGQAAGAHVVLCFFGSGAGPEIRAMLDQARRHPFFDGAFARFIGVSRDPADQGRLDDAPPGFRLFWDFDGRIAALCGVAHGGGISIVFDHRLRVLYSEPLADPQAHVGRLSALLADLPRARESGRGGSSAPVILVPRVFEPELCSTLIAHCEERPGEDSGFMSTDPATGETFLKRDPSFKSRRDFHLEDGELRLAIHARILRRLLPEIDKAFQFHVTRIERYLVARYDAAEGGFFGPHRDDGTRATAHRRFAVTINLNAEDYDGGDLRFPEFDNKTFRAPTGGAAVFSCSLMHEVVPVTRGTRYCFLPFLYDEVSAKLREENLKYLRPAVRDEVSR
jgi:peroxiredoxin